MNKDERCHGNCCHSNLELDFENEIAIRTCELSGEQVPICGHCEQWSMKLIDVDRNPAVIDNLANKDVSEIAHYA